MEAVRKECQCYSRYLAGVAATPYVVEKYLEFHGRREGFTTMGRFDRWLVAASAQGPLWAKLADSYAARFARHSMLRKKLVLMLALLECAPPASAYLDAVDGGGRLRLWARLAMRVAGAALALVAGVLLFAPLHLAAAVFPGRPAR